jgi:GNAT superfamily N-acetyltransferase
MRPSRDASRSASVASAPRSGSGIRPTTVISSRSTVTSRSSLKSPSGIRPANQPRSTCSRSYFAELDTRFAAGFDPSLSIPALTAELTEPAGLLLVARLRDEPIGCGVLKLHGAGPAEIKRMWVADSARGLGVGRRLLEELEQHACRRGAHLVRLETNKTLGEAIHLFRSAGYVEVAPFNDEPYAHHWFEKRLDDVNSGL